MGPDHQVTARLPRPAAAVVARPMSASLTVSQRVRVTVWFHTSRWVPFSSSRPISGAPQNSPTRAGRISTTAMSARKTAWWSSKNRPVNVEQSPVAERAAFPEA